MCGREMRSLYCVASQQQEKKLAELCSDEIDIGGFVIA
jgi:hypothetical protein